MLGKGLREKRREGYLKLGPLSLHAPGLSSCKIKKKQNKE
jgi:hypothetical protein